MKYIRTGTSLVLMLIFTSFTQADDKGSVSVEVSNAYVNSMPPGVNITAGFFEIKNIGKVSITLDNISSPMVEKIELHRTENVDGKMTMRKITALVIGASEKVKLEHGGIHLMLWGLDKSLIQGGNIPLSLTFANGLVIKTQAELRDIRGMTSHHH